MASSIKINLDQGGAKLRIDGAGGAQVTPDSGTQAAAIAAVATADADATYGQPEADLINELKTKVNSALAALRAVGIIAT